MADRIEAGSPIDDFQVRNPICWQLKIIGGNAFTKF